MLENDVYMINCTTFLPKTTQRSHNSLNLKNISKIIQVTVELNLEND
jgi:hypothetical protein